MTGAGFFGWAIDSIIASALLMLGILLLRTRLRRVAGPQVAYALWALPVLRLVLPPLPHWPTAIATPVSQAGETIVVLIAPAAAPTLLAQPAAAFPVAAVLVGIWVVGAVLFLGWHVSNHRRFLPAYRRGVGIGRGRERHPHHRKQRRARSDRVRRRRSLRRVPDRHRRPVRRGRARARPGA